MGYCEASDIENITAYAFVSDAIANDDGNSEGDIVTAMIANADATIHMWISGKYQVSSIAPFTTVPDSVRYASARLAAAYLARRLQVRGHEADNAFEYEEQILEWLKNVADGTVTIYGASTDEPTIVTTNKGSLRRYLTDDQETEGGSMDTLLGDYIDETKRPLR